MDRHASSHLSDSQNAESPQTSYSSDSELRPGIVQRGLKRRPSRAGTRSVSTLTPVQLERKRANDREAQRAIRQRTKDHIENLERKIADLTSGDTNTKLMHALQRIESLEQENTMLRARLGQPASVYSPGDEEAMISDSALASPPLQSNMDDPSHMMSRRLSTASHHRVHSIHSPNPPPQTWSSPHNPAPLPMVNVGPTIMETSLPPPTSSANWSQVMSRVPQHHDTSHSLPRMHTAEQSVPNGYGYLAGTATTRGGQYGPSDQTSMSYEHVQPDYNVTGYESRSVSQGNSQTHVTGYSQYEGLQSYLPEVQRQQQNQNSQHLMYDTRRP